MFDLGAAVHDNLHAKGARPLGCLIVLNTELHPNDLGFGSSASASSTAPAVPVINQIRAY